MEKIGLGSKRSKVKLEKYKQYDGLMFDYNLDFPNSSCRIDLPNGDFLRLGRVFCDLKIVLK